MLFGPWQMTAPWPDGLPPSFLRDIGLLSTMRLLQLSSSSWGGSDARVLEENLYHLYLKETGCPEAKDQLVYALFYMKLLQRFWSTEWSRFFLGSLSWNKGHLWGFEVSLTMYR